MLIKHISGYEVESPDKIAKKLLKTGKFEAVKKVETKPPVKKAGKK